MTGTVTWTKQWPQQKGYYYWMESDIGYLGVGVATICERTDYRKPEHWEQAVASPTTTTYKSEDGRDLIVCWDCRYIHLVKAGCHLCPPQPEYWSVEKFVWPAI